MIGWAIVVGYLTVALLVARKTFTRWYHDGAEMDAFTPLGALALGLIWPLLIPYLGAVRLVTAPAAKDQERRDRLEADRDAWRTKLFNGTPEEKKMAEEVLRVLNDALDAERRRR